MFSLAFIYVSIEIIKVVNEWMLSIVPECALLQDFPICQELWESLRVFGYIGLV